MKSRNLGEIFKNATGTIFLLAAAFFVCSTFLSMRAVLADPVAPTQITGTSTQSPRAGNAAAGATRASPRGNATSMGRTGGATAATSRAVASRATAAPSSAARNVVNRAATSRAASNRTVISRSATTPSAQARVSLQGSAIRGSKAATTTSYQYLSNKLYTGNYSNIIDSSTGLISAEAYDNCMTSYYTCMDEICTARNAAQRRCACAGRVKAFAAAETSLESANEELIKVSGELALLIATKGKDISDAFKLTDAEKVLNCVSWQEMNNECTSTNSAYCQASDSTKYTSLKEEWCVTHGIYANAATCSKPDYCESKGNSFGFDVADLNGSGSDILASLKSWADAKDKTVTITSSDNASLKISFDNMTNIVGGLTGSNLSLNDDGTLKDSLAETWGYELFEYAHNNVCNRVLDSCFNGIYEACGNPGYASGTSSHARCSNGASQCPYNYNSYISVKADSGTYELNFINSNVSGSSTSSATCFGYTSASGDPYSNLRGPVADARRSILQKYALDANADCDAYGEQLRTTSQNIGYQKVAAQQALQKKRLEFVQEEATTTRNDAISAGTNFNQCMTEIYECYTAAESANPLWSTSRIKTYCATVANAPSCYETMICNPSAAQFQAVIDKQDSTSCTWSQDYAKNTCRNVVTLTEILTKAAAAPAKIPADGTIADSAEIREQCLQDAIGDSADSIRNWKRTPVTP